jgi:hypothetical protein
MKKFLGAAMSAAVIMTPAAVRAADFDGSKPLICATVETHECDIGESCKRGLAASVGAPQFMRIDFAKQVIAGPKRTTPFKNIEKDDKQVVLQGTELGLGWTIAIDAASGEFSAAMVNRETAVMLFGACTPQ